MAELLCGRAAVGLGTHLNLPPVRDILCKELHSLRGVSEECEQRSGAQTSAGGVSKANWGLTD